MKSLPIQLQPTKTEQLTPEFLQTYERKFKALADEKRLEILHEITKQGSVCVCDLSETIDMKQSKLSYHLKILLDAGIIQKETKGTWNYYKLNHDELDSLLAEDLCCIFR